MTRTSSVAPGPIGVAPQNIGNKNAGNSATRQIQGLLLIQRLAPEIRQAAQEFEVPAKLVAVIVMHESQAIERSEWQWGFLGGIIEWGQTKVQDSGASIGVGQMQIKVANRLHAQYTQFDKNRDVVDDLRDEKRAVRYVAAELRYIFDELKAFLAVHRTKLTKEAILDLLAVGYNIGWENLRDKNLTDGKMGGDVRARVQTIRRDSRYLPKTTANFQLISHLVP